MVKYKKGDKVKCINDHFEIGHHPAAYKYIGKPKRNQIYTIREVVETQNGDGVKLEEIVNDPVDHDKGGYKEPIFLHSRFKLATDEYRESKLKEIGI